MTKVYPRATQAISKRTTEENKHFLADKNAKSGGILTVWKKSLLFNCDGFTVFDNKGNLVFRVDNYSVATKADINLMDASGNSLLTIRRKRLSMLDNWLMYKGETGTDPILSVKKHINLLNTKSLAHASASSSSSSCSRISANTNNKSRVVYEIEGSYTRRCCKIYDENKKIVAEIRPKEATIAGVGFGLDVFHLIIHPEIDPAVAMALVILLDQMFRSSNSIGCH